MVHHGPNANWRASFWPGPVRPRRTNGDGEGALSAWRSARSAAGGDARVGDACVVEAVVTTQRRQGDTPRHPRRRLREGRPADRRGRGCGRQGRRLGADPPGRVPRHPRLLALLIARRRHQSAGHTPLVHAAHLRGDRREPERDGAAAERAQTPVHLHRQVQDGARLRAQVPPGPPRSALRLRRPRPGPGARHARQAGQNRRSPRRQDRALRRWTRLRAHGRLVGQLVIGLKRLSAGAAARRQVIESHFSEAPSEFDIRERRRYQPRLIEYSPASSYRK